MNVTLGRAINLLNSGFSVMPISEGKKPLILWKEYQTKKIEKAELEKLESKTKGYGIITGFYGVECIDVDLKVFPSVHEGKKFWTEFVSFISDHIDDFARKFVIYKTINSGYHIIYRCEKVEGNRKLATLKGHSQALIETRGNGGYIYIYDNQISDLSYEQITEITIEERDTLMSLCKYFHYEEAIVETKPKEADFSGLTPWDDYNHRNRVIDLVQGEFSAIKHLSDRIVLRKVDSKDALHGFIYKDTGLCFLFTTATIYPHETPLSPFAIYAWKYFGGNFSEAAKELYKEGYGERKIKKVEIERIEIPKEELIFPIEVFPEALQSYILLNQKTLNHSIDYMGSSLLWLIALCIGNACKVEVKTGWRESVNIWIGLIGKAGLGKTPSINAIIFPISKKNSFEIKHYQNEYKKYKEYDKLSTKEKKDVEEVKEPVRKQLIVNDVTIEALADLHEENEVGIAVFKDELNGWIKDMNKYKPGSDLEFWLSCWSNQQAILTRKTAKSSFIQSPLIPVLGGIQPGIFSQISTLENKDNGFLDRLLVCYPEKEIEHYNRNSIDQEVLDWYEAFMSQFYDQMRKNILQLNKFGDIESRIIKFDSEAEHEWERIFNNITDMQNSDDTSEYVKSMLSKQKAYIPRFALIMNCIWAFETGVNFDWVTKDSLLKAEKLSNYFIAMSKKIKLNSLESTELSELVRSLKSEPIEKKIQAIQDAIPDFNRSELAELLNVSRTTIYKHLRK
jgi:predicted DNA binding protein